MSHLFSRFGHRAPGLLRLLGHRAPGLLRLLLRLLPLLLPLCSPLVCWQQELGASHVTGMHCHPPIRLNRHPHQANLERNGWSLLLTDFPWHDATQLPAGDLLRLPNNHFLEVLAFEDTPKLTREAFWGYLNRRMMLLRDGWLGLRLRNARLLQRRK